MSIIYRLDEFKQKLKTCDDADDVHIVYAVVVDQVAHIKQAIADLREKLEQKESRLAEVSLDAYKAAMIERIREIAGK